MIGAGLLALATPQFTLEWQHSVARTGWRETWALTPGGLQLTQAAVQGSGAGMEPGAGARLQGGWWVWAPALAPQPDLRLATSGTTAGGWRICDATRCHAIPETGGDVVLRPCPALRSPGSD